jgi:hypothetical protein
MGRCRKIPFKILTFVSHYTFPCIWVTFSNILGIKQLPFSECCILSSTWFTSICSLNGPWRLCMAGDSSVGVMTRYGLDSLGIESWWVGRFSAPVQTGPWANPASYTMGTGPYPGVKQPGHGIAHPPPSSSKVEGRVELYLYCPCGPLWPVIGWPLPLPVWSLCSLFRWNRQSVPRRQHLNYRRWGITQKQAYNIL